MTIYRCPKCGNEASVSGAGVQLLGAECGCGVVLEPVCPECEGLRKELAARDELLAAGVTLVQEFFRYRRMYDHDFDANSLRRWAKEIIAAVQQQKGKVCDGEV